MAKANAVIKATGEQNTETEAATPFECSTCHQSIRFVPLYMFNDEGNRAQLVLQQGPPMIMCAGCRAVYKWDRPTTDTAHDGGWSRHGLLEDALEHAERTK